MFARVCMCGLCIYVSYQAKKKKKKQKNAKKTTNDLPDAPRPRSRGCSFRVAIFAAVQSKRLRAADALRVR